MVKSTSSVSCFRLTLFTILAVVIQIIGLSLFVLGFFPVKPALSGVSGPESFHSPDFDYVEEQNLTSLSPDELKSLYRELSKVPPLFDRLVLMVIDGLPAEFVFGKDDQPPSEIFRESMPYTQSLLSNRMVAGYHAKAAPPTVTMPRLKAMVSGSIGGFLDVAFNFDTQALSDDNLIGQFLKIGWKMVMLGDETWLKLFPGSFTRHDGVSSFFVKDTVEVDYNVSRHLNAELDNTDWKLLILHYLGLDHVGHTGGRHSVLMGPKLTEMDEVIKKIHLSMVQNQDNNLGRTLLMVVSDHGMTESGNHGGSSYEETDSLILLIGLSNCDYARTIHTTVSQVDIAPTLAVLFGVPIPKNNAGTVLFETLISLPDDQQLRALELNSWQLFRLLRAQLPDLSCCIEKDDQGYGIGKCDGSLEEIFCCLYVNAAALHKSWKSNKDSRSNREDDHSRVFFAYHEFLKTASEWLSRRATNKPVGLLAYGVTAMILSCLILLSLLYCLSQDACTSDKRHSSQIINSTLFNWHLDETLTIAIILFLVLSTGSSSLIEEEQYLWHFMTATLFLVLLRKAIQSVSVRRTMQSPVNLIEGQNNKEFIQMFSIIVLVISSRILRGWHQGGVNWTHYPDISKSLLSGGVAYIKSSQLVSLFLVIALSFYALSFSCSRRNFAVLIRLILLFPGLLVLQHIIKYQSSDILASSYNATLMIQLIYATLGTSVVGIVVALPWIMRVRKPESFVSPHSCVSKDDVPYSISNVVLEGITESLFLIGLVYVTCWCLVQLLLQQPVNAMPVSLLLVQILANMSFSLNTEPKLTQWVEVAALYYLGMAGHFSLGNTNTLATIDIAGAFMGITSHSTILPGILMFIITYASPMLTHLSIIMSISKRGTSFLVNTQNVDLQDFFKMTLGYPSLVPLSLNSVLLVTYTIVLLLMSNHLFVWSVFSPKYMYVCATTACVYLGVFVVASTVFYTVSVFALRRTLHNTRL